ncbi:MAG: RimK family alpha-L-glutamate ligase [Planctomycetaceae bacterium]|nr:RimK family alpha-L-glutamate ligase [Planctomycetaceae bacterium]
MRCGVLCSPDSWYLADLRRASQGAHEIVALSYRDLATRIQGGRVEVVSTLAETGGRTTLNEFDVIVVRTMPPGSLEQVVARMDLLGILEGQGVLVVNPPRAIEVAVDKFLATARLAAAGLRVPRTFVCQTVAEGLAAFAALGHDAVLKPLFGSEGRGVTRIGDRAAAQTKFRQLVEQGDVLYLQEFIDHPGFDLRVLLIGDRAISFARRNLLDWRTNLSLGGEAERRELEPDILRLAHRAAEAVGAPLAGVDLIQAPAGDWHVLEVNAVPGWKATSLELGLDIGQLVIDYLARLVQQRQHR